MATWLAAATTAPPEDVAVLAPPPVIPATGGALPPSTAAAGLAADMERLRERLAEAPALRTSARNPFSLAPPPRPRPETLEPPSSRSAAPVTSRRPRASRPSVQLIGIATTDLEGGAERTGIVTTRGGEVLLVRTGDRVPGGYRVDVVEPSSVTLVDGSGASHRLTLP